MENDWSEGIAYCGECGKQFESEDSVTIDSGPDGAICSDACYDAYIEGPSLTVTSIVTNGEEPDIIY
jgi:hypothetical protein